MMMKLKEYLVFCGLLASAVFLGGCGATLVNLTAANQSQNPSGIYTLQTEVDIQDRAVVQDTVQLSVVIGKETVPMVKGQISDKIWSCDYKLPEKYDKAHFYYVATYQVLHARLLKPRRVKSQLYRFQLENRFVGNLLAYRAPIGNKISIQGRGFTKHDQVQFGSEIVATKFLSENELQFTVPPLPSGIDYSLQLIGGAGKLPIGDFRIDESEMQVDPKVAELASGEVVTFLFRIDFEAPEGGLPVKIETDVPDSIIMPKIRIPSGAKSVSAPLKGGSPGNGSIFVNVPGIKEVAIPVTVTGNAPEIIPEITPEP